jgi:hypothetical protein
MNGVFDLIKICGFEELQHLAILPRGEAIVRAYKVACGCIFLYSKLVFPLFLVKADICF